MTQTDRNRKYIKSAELKKLCEDLHKMGKKIVLTLGSFDLIHSGHAAYLLKAKSYGDILIVGVASNSSKRKLRGKGLPLIDQKNRMELLSYFKFVDYTTLVTEQNVMPVLRKIKPDIYYTLGIDWKSHLRKSKEERFVKKYGGKIVKTARPKPYVSASAIVEYVADLKIKEVIEYFFGKIKIDLSKGDWRSKWGSGLKTRLRSESLYFGQQIKNLGLFSQQFLAQMIDENELKSLGSQLREQKKKIVLSSGACDLLHAAHARFFYKAKSYGDVLVLAIPSNRVVQKQKGRGRPIVHEYSRAELMAFFDFVDYVVIIDSESISPVIENLRPNVFFTVEEDWNNGKISLQKLMAEWKGKVVSVPPQSPNLSSSKLIRKATGLRVRQVFKEVLDEAEKWTALKD